MQINSNTLFFKWNYPDEYVNPIISIQTSKDGNLWNTVQIVNNKKETEITSDFFNENISGEIVYFRILVNTNDFFNKTSNRIEKEWEFNDFVIKEINRTENIDCGTSHLTFEIKGTVDCDIIWEFDSIPGGGDLQAINNSNGTEIISLSVPYGNGDSLLETTHHNLIDETLTIQITMHNTDKNENLKILNCFSGNESTFVYAGLRITIVDNSNLSERYMRLDAFTKKYFIDRPTIDTEPF